MLGKMTAQTEQPNGQERQKEDNSEDNKGCKINWNYAPIKAHYFFLFAGLGGTMPYIQVLAKDFGISATSVGIIFTIVPLCVCLAKPLFGFMTDKFRNLRAILLILLLVTALSYYAILYIPSINNNGYVTIQANSTCMDEGSELNIDPPPYYSTCGEVIVNKQFMCNFTSNKCIQNKILPGTLFVSNTLRIVENDMHLSFTFKFSNESPSVLDCDCFKYNISDLTCDSSLFECDHNIKPKSEYKLYNFWIFVLLAVLSGTGSATITCLSDAACYEVLRDNPRSYGRQRLWGTISWGLTTLTTGYLNDIATANSADTNYSPGFYLMLIFIAIDIIIVCKLPLEKASISPSISSSICKDVGTIFSSWQTALFSFGVYICGALTGLLWTYQFWYLTELGSSQLLLGLVAAVQCLIAEVPFFFFSGWFIKKFGHFYCLIATLAAFSLRIGLYSILENPWMVLPIEVLHGITFGIFYSAMTLYAADCAPPGTEATMLGILGGLFEGLGVATGSFLGGIGFDNMGGRWTFFVVSMFSVACIPLFTITYKIIQRSQGSLDLDRDSSINIGGISNYGSDNRDVQ